MKTVGFLQFQVAFGKPGENLAAIERLVSAPPHADLLVLPELATTGYEFRDRTELAQYGEEYGDGPLSDFLKRLSSATGTTFVIGYAEKAGAHYYNSAMIVTPQGMAGNYRKVHLFSRENDLFDPGDKPFQVFDTPVGKIGVMICFDWFFPEAARSLAMSGAQIIAHPSNLVLPWCQRAMFARSVENRVFTITANRTGTEERAGRKLAFTGASQILNPEGTVLAAATATGEAVMLARIKPSVADDKQLNEHNNLQGDRRPEMYGK